MRKLSIDGHHIYSLKRNPELRLIDLSFNEIPIAAAENLFKTEKIHCIVHAATQYGRDSSVEPVLEANLELPLMLLQWRKEQNTPFINVDSYFNKPENKYYALPNYSLSKKALLMWLEYYSEFRPIYNLRLEHIYGPKDSPDKFVSTAINEIATQKVDSFKCTSGQQIRDFIYVDDVSEAFSLVVNSLENGSSTGLKTYEIGTGIETSIKDFLQLVKKLSFSNTFLDFDAIPIRKSEIMVSAADSKFSEDFTWKYSVDLATGIKMILDNS